jgi:hypothetical protein
MGISDTAKQVVSAPLDPNRVKQRPGKGGMTFDYIPAEYVIELLNQAFDYDWSSRVIDSLQVDQDILVLLELQLNSENGNVVVKQQYGSSTLKPGVAPGDAYKSAASDALKKCATLLGVALELYRDEPAVSAAPPQKPSRPSSPPRPAPAPAKAPAPPASGAVPPRPPAAPPRPPVPPRTTATPAASAPPSPAPRSEAPAAPAATPRRAAVPAPSAPTPPTPRANPFEKKNKGGDAGPNPTQLNALANLATKRGVGESGLIALASILDETGHPKQRFDDLSHSEAIQVIQASQR